MKQKKQTIASAGQILMLPVNMIEPNRDQPRKYFSLEELEGLAQSIHENGMLQPVSVRIQSDRRYELIAGERRLRAAKMIGMQMVPAIILDVEDGQSAVYALLENLQRQDLSYFEEARAIEALMLRYGYSQEETAVRLGKAQSTLSNKLRLLKLPPDVQADIERAGLTERHARALLKLEDVSLMREVVKHTIDKKLNVSQTEQLIEESLLHGAEKPARTIKVLFRDVRIFVNTLNHAVNTMRRSGIQADSEKMETEQYIEYIVRIPKNNAYKDRQPASGGEPVLQVRSR